MENPQTLEDVAHQIVKLTSYGLGYGTSMSRIREQVREYLEKHVQLRRES